MKKVLHFLQSMTFGIILLGIVCVLSLIGSLIPQGESAMYYVQQYSWYHLLLGMSFDHIFTSWYFIVIVVLLCINLIFCSIIRWNKIHPEQVIESAKNATTDIPLNAEDRNKVKEVLEKRHCRKTTYDKVTVYEKNRIGYYGTFITHLGILLTVIFFAIAMYSPTVIDQTCLPGESITLEDGTEIAVQDFHIEDEEGNLDYESTINIILTNGKESGWKQISVNHPARLGNYKVYQQTYGTIGCVIVTDAEGNQDTIVLEDSVFLSKDGQTGIWYNTLYPDFVQDGEDFSLITSVTGHYENPVYTFNLVELNDEEGSSDELKMTPMLAFPGDSIEIGGLTYTFQEPIEYPGLRIKVSLSWVNMFLILSFLILTIGLFITFFISPILVVVTEDGYRILGTKTEGITMWIHSALKKGSN